MKASDFDQKFDEGQEDIIEHLDLNQATRPNLKRVNVDFSPAIVEEIDEFAG
jgi:hypothetical protein